MNLPNGINYRFLDFPALPLDLEQVCIDQLKNKECFLFDTGRIDGSDQTYQGNMVYRGVSVFKKQCIFAFFNAPQIVKEWLLDNRIIDDIAARVGVQRSYGGNALLPHVDKGHHMDSRSIAWNYLLSEPGPRTCFYQTSDINSVTESIVIPKSVWHELDVSVLHGVENIETDRISLSISFNK